MSYLVKVEHWSESAVVTVSRGSSMVGFTVVKEIPVYPVLVIIFPLCQIYVILFCSELFPDI